MKHGTEWDDPTAEAVIMIDETKALLRRASHLAAINEAAGNKGLARQYQCAAYRLLATIPSEHRRES